jgi:hypothetical protein
MKKSPDAPEARDQLLRQIEQLARRALFGTISETYRTCGSPGCRCHGRAQNTVRIFTSVTAVPKARPRAITCPKRSRLKCAHRSPPGMNFKISYGVSPSSIGSDCSPNGPLRKNALLQQALAKRLSSSLPSAAGHLLTHPGRFVIGNSHIPRKSFPLSVAKGQNLF